MKILMLCQRLPYPPNKGEKIRAYHHLRLLARKHEVTLASLVDDAADLAHVPRLREFAVAIETVPIARTWAKVRGLWALPLGESMTLRYFDSIPFRDRIRALLSQNTYDLIFVYSSAMAQYATHTREIPIVIDFVDVDSQKWLQYARHMRFPMSLLYRIEAQRLRTYERHVGNIADAIILVSRTETALFQAIAPSARASVLPMAVDTDCFSPNGFPPSADSPTLIFTGVMDYFPNVDAVQYFSDEIFPRIRELEQRVRFLIVGQRPNRQVQRLGRIQGIEVTGAVPDVRPFFEKAHIALAPFRLAQGMQTKILEAMAMRLPVVATPPAFQGIEAKVGTDIFVEDEPARFASRVVDLLRDRKSRHEIGQRAREFVMANHAPESVAAQLEALLHSTVARRMGSELSSGVGRS